MESHQPEGRDKLKQEFPRVSNTESLRVLAEVAKARSGERTYFWGTMLGIAAGAIFCLSGFVMTVLGLAGSIDWIVEVGAFQSRLANAGPGAFFALLGMIILWRYKPRIKETLELQGDKLSSESDRMMG